MSNGNRVEQKRQRRRAFLSVCFVLLLMFAVLGGATVFLWDSLPSRNVEKEASVPLFGVQKITVTGDTRYVAEDIVKASGIHEGQSIFSLNKVAAHDTILKTFPYLETVEIFNDSFNTVEIRVKEAEAVGAFYWKGQWLVVGSNGKGLETMKIQSDRPPRYVYLRGVAATEEAGVGSVSLNERTLSVINTLLEACEEHSFEGVCELDLSDLTDIRLRLHDRITIKFGNATQLAYQVAVLKQSLPYVYESYGKKAEGLLDISSYSNEDSTDIVVFTLQETLDEREKNAADSTGSTTESTELLEGGETGVSGETTDTTAAETEETEGTDEAEEQPNEE